MKITGENIRNMRRGARHTVQEIADMVGVSKDTFQNYENGSVSPPLNTFIEIYEYCYVDIVSFLRDKRHHNNDI